MNEGPPNEESPDIDDHFRRAAALDPSRPSDSVRRAVLVHAARLAAERKRVWWRPAIVGTLAAAALAGLLIAPDFLTPHAPPVAVHEPPQVARPAAAPPVADESLASSPPAVATAPVVAPPPAAAAQNVQAAPRAMLGAPNTAGARTMAAPMPQAMRRSDPAAALRRAAEIGDIPGLQALLDERIGIDARDAGGRTALMLATLHGRADAVDALLAHGADPNAADAQGTTPLQAAEAGDQPAIVAALRRAGAR